MLEPAFTPASNPLSFHIPAQIAILSPHGQTPIFRFSKVLSETAGVPGREERIREILRREAKPLFDKISVDPMGSLIATKKSSVKNAKKVLFACHMDGRSDFMSGTSGSDGHLRIQNAGEF